MKTVILCGGKGMRLKEFTETIPKPLVAVGPYPILWHVMKTYSHYGFNDFVLCLGYLGNKVKELFINHLSWEQNQFTIDLCKNDIQVHGKTEPWKITFADTGLDTNTGGRIKKIERFIEDENFMCTYADGLADIDLKKLADFHQSKEKTATVTVVNPYSRFGILSVNENDEITAFKEKPKLDSYINGGFFVFNRKIFDFLDDNSVLEKEPFENLAKERQIAAFKHEGFWACMDTFKDNLELHDYWQSGKAPWKVWQ